MARARRLPTFASTDDLIKVTGMSRTTLYKWADEGLLPAPVQLGETLFAVHDDLPNVI